MAKWTPNDETHATRVLQTVAKEGSKDLKNKKHKLYKNPALAVLIDAAERAVEVVNAHEATKEKVSAGKFIYTGTGINLVVTAVAAACVAKMKTLGMAVPQ